MVKSHFETSIIIIQDQQLRWHIYLQFTLSDAVTVWENGRRVAEENEMSQAKASPEAVMGTCVGV